MTRPTTGPTDPEDILLAYALGDMVGYAEGEGSPTTWARPIHRGVHLLRAITFPKSQRRYVLSPQFDLRFDTAFEQTLHACADLRRTGHTWITPDLVRAYTALHHMGFAHSFEAWQNDQLVGGAFGVQIGAYISVESMFYRVSNASKAAYGRTLLTLKERGFLLVDSNPVKDASRNYGEEWIPQWQFESLLHEAVHKKATLADHIPCPEFPAKVRRLLPLSRFVRRFATRLKHAAAPFGLSKFTGSRPPRHL